MKVYQETDLIDIYNSDDSISKYITNKCHPFSYESSRYQFTDAIKYFSKLSHQLAEIIELNENIYGIDLNIDLRFTFTLERTSEHIFINDNDTILLDMHQVFGYVEAIYLTYIANYDSFTAFLFEEEKSEYLLSSAEKLSQSNNIDMDSFLDLIQMDTDIVAPNFLHNLADLFYSLGYIDTAIMLINCIGSIPMKNVKAFPKDISVIVPHYLMQEFTETVSIFILAHELNHTIFKKKFSSLNIQTKIKKITFTLSLVNKMEILWQELVMPITKRNIKYKAVIHKIIKNIKLSNFANIQEILNKTLDAWSNIDIQRIKDEDIEELFCDLEAINNIFILSNNKDFDFSFKLSEIFRTLIIQETLNTQKGIIQLLTNNIDTLKTINIKRIQLIICCMLLINKRAMLPVEMQEMYSSIINSIEFNKNDFMELIQQICGELDYIHECYYIPSILNTLYCFQSGTIHKEVYSIYYENIKKENFCFTENFSPSQNINPNLLIEGIDFIMMQDSLLEAYLMYKDYIFNRRLMGGDNMLTVEFLSEDTQSLAELKSLPTEIKEYKTKHFDADPVIVTLLVSITPIVVNQLGKVIISIINKNKNVKVKYKGMEIQGLSADQILKLLDKISADK